MDKLQDFRGETVHNYIGILMDMILDIDGSQEIGNLDKNRIGVLLSDAIHILNEY